MLQTSLECLEKTRLYAESSHMYIKQKINRPESQCVMVLIVVSIALLLDNMLYMVIVPIIPHYLMLLELPKNPNVLQHLFPLDQNVSNDKEPNWLVLNVTHNSREIGFLFACKAIVQLLVNPISGMVIDRIGYDIPMMIGLIIICISTTAFAFGQDIKVMFLARGLQGVGSAFADTSGLAMIADRFTEESRRAKALGIALAFISFGSLVAPPFGGILYQYVGKEAPFFILAFIALLDGFMLMFIMKPVRLERRELQAEGSLPKATPIHRLLMDPYIAICAGCLAVANISLAFLEPTITNWMLDWENRPTKSQIGLVWLPSFFPHVAGVYTTVKMSARYPKYQWLMAAVGLALEGISCIFVPMCSNFVTLMLPLCLLCFGIALVDTAILPTLGYIVDTRHVSVYGSVYAIADISYSLAYAIGPIAAGNIVNHFSFAILNGIIFISTCAYVPVLYLLRNNYQGDVNKFVNTDEDPNIVRPGRKRSYLMNGASLESKNVVNVNSTADTPAVTNQKLMEKDLLIDNGAPKGVQYNTIQCTDSVRPESNYYDTGDYYTQSIKTNQYSY